MASRTRSEVGRTSAGRRAGEAPAPARAADHTHGPTVVRPRLGDSPGSTRAAAGGGPPAPVGRQLLKRKAASSSLEEEPELVGQEAVAVEPRVVGGHRLGDLAGGRRGGPGRAAARPACRSLRPFWRAPRIVPSPRSSRSTSASSKPSVVRSRASSRVAPPRGGAGAQQVAPARPRSARPTRPRSWWSWAMPKRSASSITITVASGTSTPDLDRRSWPPAPGARPRGRRPSPPPCRPRLIWPCSRPSDSPASSLGRPAARAPRWPSVASTRSDPSTSGQTT